MSTVGALAVDALRLMTADHVVRSADEVVAEHGLCEASLDQVALKSLMRRQSRGVLADVGKLGRAGQNAWAALPRKWMLVTNPDAPRDHLQLLANAGADILVGQGGSRRL